MVLASQPQTKSISAASFTASTAQFGLTPEVVGSKHADAKSTSANLTKQKEKEVWAVLGISPNLSK